MRLSTRLALSGAVSVAVVALIGAVLASTTRTVRRELARNEAAGEMLSAVTNVRYLTLEYALHHDERTLVQWHLTHASLSKQLVARPEFATGAEGEILARLRRTNAVVRSLFSQLVANRQARDTDGRRAAVREELEARLTGQIVIRLEGIIADAFTLSERSRTGVLTAQRRQGVAVGAFGGFVLLVLATTMIVALKSVLRPLARLRAGTAIVGAGDLDFRLDEASGDEIGDLAHAFNEMTEKLRGREAKIRRLVDSNIIGIVITDLEGEVLEANDAFLELVGYSRLDLQSGRVDWKRITPAEFEGADVRALQELRERGAYAPFEKEYFRKDGRRIPVMIGGALLEGPPRGGVAFVLDLTERRVAQETLARTQADLAHVARVTTLGALTASIAHEVNQPLSGIITNASTCLRMLAADPPNVDGARETARRTIRDGHRASDVITRLRGLFAREGVATESVDLNEAAREVIALSASELRSSRVIVRAELADDLPPVRGDCVQLQQVILNLFRNASDAMSGVDDRPRQLVISTAREEGDRVRLTVQDAGVGFEPESAEKLFDPFYTTKRGGMGIGLSVSRSIIESHHGRLWAARNDGPGATFAFTLPRAGERAASAHGSSAVRAPAAADAMHVVGSP